jgi:signal transduction histidine kinase/ActR/RegA family two-component response regulator
VNSSLRESLVTRLVMWVVAIALATFALLSSLQLWSDYRAQVDARSKESEAAIALARGPTGRALWNLDEDSLSQFVMRLSESGVIVRADVLDTRGRTVASAARAGVSDERATLRSVELVAPDGGQVIGRLDAYESVTLIRQQIGAAAWRAIGFELAKLAALSLALSWVFNRLVLRRLRHLDSQVRALAPDDNRTRLTDTTSGGTPRDEIGNMIAAANQLLDARAALQDAQSKRQHAEAANRAKSEFISRVSHELRTPLNAVLGFAQALELGGAVPEGRQRQDLQRISQAGWHLAQLINDLLDLSRIEAGSLQLQLEAVPLAICVEQAVTMVRSDAEAAGVRVDVEHPGAVHVRADALRLRQVLVNLLSNAVKYNRSGGQVRVTVAAGAERVAIAVADTGIGMSESDLSRLYEPFNRLGREASNRPGTGIGLVITKGLVEVMGGTLDVKSRVGEGSTFTVHLPLTASTSMQPAAAAVLAQHHDQRERRVLYIEDEPVNVEVMRALLGRRGHITLDTAGSLADAALYLRERRPDLVLLDMNLPDGTGGDFLARRLSDRSLNRSPVIVVSADASDDAMTQALLRGASAFIAKPIDFATALAQIDALLRD